MNSFLSVFSVSSVAHFHLDEQMARSSDQRETADLARLARVKTRPTPQMPGFLAQADLLVIEGTYGDPADAENAIENKHLLFSEAAEIGRQTAVRQIWLTHFSAKLLDPQRFAGEAQRIVPATTIGHEGLTTSLRFEDEEPPG